MFGLLVRFTGPPAIMLSADQVPVKTAHSKMRWLQEIGYTPRLLIGHFHLRFPHPSSASRFTAGAAGFLNLSQCEPRRFNTMPSQPSRQAWR